MLSILLLSGLTLLQVTSQEIVDDVYFRPGDVQQVQNERVTPRLSSNAKPNYKNGAKEIVFLDSRQSRDIILTGDSIFILAEMNDSIMNDTLYSELNQEEGYYLNEFKGTDTEYEYAERIRRFHNPKFTVHISDPQYTDIYFLNDNDWNIYVDGSYAWVTPTWTNPAWWNYYWTPYSYNSWFWRSSLYSPWGYHHNWHGFPGFGMGYGWNSFYGGYYPYHGGFWGGGMFGYGYPYHFYSWHYPFSGGYFGHSNRKQNYSENVRREYSGFANSTSNNTRISGGSQALPGSSRASAVYASNSDRNVNNNRRTVYSIPGSDGLSVSGRSATSLRNTRNPNTGLAETGIRTRSSNTVRSADGAINNARVDNQLGQRNQNNIQINRNTANPTPTAVRRQNDVSGRTTSATVVRSGTGTSPVRSSSVTSGSSSGSSEQFRNNSSTSTRSTYTAPSSSSSSYSGSSRSSSPSYSAPSSSGSSSGGGGSRNSGGGSSSGGRR